MIIVIDRRPAPARSLHRRRHAALELVVVVGIQQVMLAVVLVLHHRLHCRQPLLEQLPRRLALFARAIGIAAPDDESLGQIATIGPPALVDQRLQPGAIGPWLGAEHPERCPPVRLCIVHAGFDQPGTFGPCPRGKRIVGLVLVKRRHRAHCPVKKGDLVRERHRGKNQRSARSRRPVAGSSSPSE
jgi:hypothetical protein